MIRTLAPALARAYLASYQRVLPVDAGRLRLWMPLQSLHAWAAAVPNEQGFFGASPAGYAFRADLASWAEKEFRLHMEALAT